MKEVIPGIYLLELPLPTDFPGYINICLVRGDNGYLLVDTGWNTEEAFNSLKRQLAYLESGRFTEEIDKFPQDNTIYYRYH